jgi:Fur family peroxide stress response transcriptional regulator
LITALKERAFRLAPQRVELVRLIAASKEHPSAAQHYSKIKTQFLTMSQATVYKTLALLKEMNQVLEIDLRDDGHYDGNCPSPHPHLICTRWNKIVDGDLDIDLASLSGWNKPPDIRSFVRRSPSTGLARIVREVLARPIFSQIHG